MGQYIKITNSDNKVWILPNSELRTSLSLYQPSSFKGRVLKRLLPLLRPLLSLNPVLFRKFGIYVVDYTLEKNLDIYLTRVFNKYYPISFSIFLGTPGSHKKTTIQIQNENHILGYCKISNNSDIYEMFRQEQKMLEYLKDAGISNVPECISCELITDNTYAFVQSTIKTPHSIIHHQFGEMENDFLKMMCRKTTVKMSYYQTDFYQSVNQLLNNIDVLRVNGYDVQCVIRSINIINKYYDSISHYAVCHRDFTPWNMFVESDQLFVFDFEYARYQYPFFLDAIHYLLQSGIFEKKMKAEQLWDVYQSSNIKSLFDNPEIALLSYLLDIISLYVDREKCEFKGDLCNCMDIWMRLCEIALDSIPLDML